MISAGRVRYEGKDNTEAESVYKSIKELAKTTAEWVVFGAP